MNKKPQPLTKEQLPAAFKAIQIGITEEDRLSAALELGISYITVLRYLRGEIGKAHLGNSLLNFLTERQNILKTINTKKNEQHRTNKTSTGSQKKGFPTVHPHY